MKTRWFLSLLVVILFGIAGTTSAIPLGFVAFDTFIPGPGGTNAFSINNFTGTFALPPDFPVLDPLTFLGATLTLEISNSPTQVIALGNIGPGPLLDPSGNPPVALQFPDTIDFLSATFTASLSQTSFLLADGSTLLASPAVGVTLFPSSGAFLAAGLDFALLDAAPVGVLVPEPGTMVLLGSGLAWLWVWRRRNRTAGTAKEPKS